MTGLKFDAHSLSFRPSLWPETVTEAGRPHTLPMRSLKEPRYSKLCRCADYPASLTNAQKGLTKGLTNVSPSAVRLRGQSTDAERSPLLRHQRASETHRRILFHVELDSSLLLHTPGVSDGHLRSERTALDAAEQILQLVFLHLKLYFQSLGG